MPAPLSYLTLPHLAAVKGLSHGFLTRQGGVSPPPYDSLNLAVATGDGEANVRANLEAVRQEMGFKRLASVRQVHGVEVVSLDGRPPADPLAPPHRADALIGARPGVGLMVKLADCLGLLLCDPRTRSVAAVHAGWRGLAAGIIGRSVAAMCREFGARPGDILAGISPGLGPCCAEFVNYRLEFPEELWAFGRGNNFDLWAMAEHQLVAAGLSPGNVRSLRLCSRCRPDLFFSHRGLGPRTGRMGAVIGFRAD